MKIKSLLLGSAAALVAVSGARAADAIVVEAEPMEYVKVCDMYGAGYFYIPGTETCLKFGGALRVIYSKNTGHADDENISDHATNVRLRFNIDAKNETEYGTLTSSARVQWNQSGFGLDDNPLAAGGVHDDYSDFESSAGGVGLDYAFISLAGFTVGYGDSRLSLGQWGSRVTHKANFLDYTYSAGDIALSVGIQDSAASGAAGQPDPYAILAYNGEGFGLTGYATLDTSTDNVFYGVIGNVDLSSFIPGGKFTAFWEGDGYDAATDSLTNLTGTDYGKGHTWGVRMDYKLTDSISGYTRWADYSEAAGNHHFRQSITWTIASGLTLEAQYNKRATDGIAPGRDGQYSLELTRSF